MLKFSTKATTTTAAVIDRKGKIIIIYLVVHNHGEMLD